jgi:signal peptidase I
MIRLKAVVRFYGCICILLLCGCRVKSYVEFAGAMEPTIRKGQQIEADTDAYKQSTPSRWDVVIFINPEASDKAVTSVMRIVGLPGETIQLEQDAVLINGRVLEVPAFLSAIHFGSVEHPPPKSKTGRPLPMYPLQIPPGNYFVLGDNIQNAYDSRFWGLLPGRSIIGKVVH